MRFVRMRTWPEAAKIVFALTAWAPLIFGVWVGVAITADRLLSLPKTPATWDLVGIGLIVLLLALIGAYIALLDWLFKRPKLVDPTGLVYEE